MLKIFVPINTFRSLPIHPYCHHPQLVFFFYVLILQVAQQVCYSQNPCVKQKCFIDTESFKMCCDQWRAGLHQF